MRHRALSIHTMAIALAAISFAGPAGAGIVFCGDVTDHASVQAHCDDNGRKGNKHRMDYLFDAEVPAPAWVLLGDWNSAKGKLKSGGPKRHERMFRHWLPLEAGSSFGSVFVHDGKWAHRQLHGGAPNQKVPEPGTLALLGIGLVGAALSRRRKRT